MSALSLTIDECQVWAKKHVSLHKQSRFLTDIYKKNKVVNDARSLIKELDPKNYMFIDKDVYYTHIEMLKEIAATHGVAWKTEVEHNLWIDKEDFSIHEWLKYYLNKSMLTENNVATLPDSVCKIMLGQLKNWYTEDPDVHACCLIEYLDQIHFLLMQSGSPEHIEVFNGLAEEYATTEVDDCVRCESKGRKNKRIEKFGK